MSRPTVLITGYGPYPGVDWNPSGAMLAQISEYLRDAAAQPMLFQVVTESLPVEYDAVDLALQDAVARHQPNAILMMGLRPTATCVNIERVALNLDDAVKPDNQNVLRSGQPIDPQGPPAFLSELQLDQMRDEFIRSGVPAVISNHAGAYICNRTYYLANLYAKRAQIYRPCVFVHLPWIGKPGIDRDEGTPLAMADLCAPVLSCAQQLVHALMPYEAARAGRG